MSKNVFKLQSYLDIYLDTKIDLSGASEVQVLYEKPDGTTGSWRAEVDDTTKVKYEGQEGDIDQSGPWKLQAYALIADRVALGNIVHQTFLVPLPLPE